MLVHFKKPYLATLLFVFLRKTYEFRIRNISTNEYIALIDPANGYPLVDYNAIYDPKMGDYLLKIVTSGYVGGSQVKDNMEGVNLVMSKKPLRFRFGKLSNGFIRIFSGDHCADYENGKMYLKKCVDDLSQLFNFEGNCVFCDRRRESPGSPDDIHILPSDPPVTTRMLNDYAEGIGRFKFEPKPKKKNVGAFTLNIKAKPGSNQNSGILNTNNAGSNTLISSPQLRYVKIKKTSQLPAQVSDASDFLNLSEDSEFSEDREDDSSMQTIVEGGKTVFPNSYNPSYAPVPGKPIAKGSNTYVLNPPDFGTVDPDESPLNKKPDHYQLLPSPGGPPAPLNASGKKTMETQATISIPQTKINNSSSIYNNVNLPKVFSTGPLEGQKIDIASVYEKPGCPDKKQQTPVILKYSPPMASISIPLNFFKGQNQDQYANLAANSLPVPVLDSQSNSENQMGPNISSQVIPEGSINEVPENITGNYPVTALNNDFKVITPPAPKGNSLFKGLGLEPPKNETSPIVQKPSKANPIENWANFLKSRLGGIMPFAKNKKVQPKKEPPPCPGSPGCPDNPSPPGFRSKAEPLVCPGNPGCPDNPITPVGPVFPEKSFSPIAQPQNDVNKYLKKSAVPKINTPYGDKSFFGPAASHTNKDSPDKPPVGPRGNIPPPKLMDKPEIVTPAPASSIPPPISNKVPERQQPAFEKPGNSLLPTSNIPPTSKEDKNRGMPYNAPTKEPPMGSSRRPPFLGSPPMGMHQPIPMPSPFGMPPPPNRGFPSPHMMMMGPPSISMASPMMMGPPSMGIPAPCACSLPSPAPVGSDANQCPCSQR